MRWPIPSVEVEAGALDLFFKIGRDWSSTTLTWTVFRASGLLMGVACWWQPARP